MTSLPASNPAIPQTPDPSTSPTDDAVAARQHRLRGRMLKLCIFATGFSGIVAEYAMSTLASYLLGNSVKQWTLIISLMLFAMGLGSRFSKHLNRRLLTWFVLAETILSLLCAASATFIYFIAAFTESLAVMIYSVAMAIGFLIGMEMPLATRINEEFEELRYNISTILEKDYYGALLGGLLFAFVALPYLGLTYTPIILGMINLAAAIGLTAVFKDRLAGRHNWYLAFFATGTSLLLLALFAKPIVLFGEQARYRDKVIYQEQTPYQRIVLTRWKQDHWLYLNGHQQFSSYDEAHYHEPLVHPAMALSQGRRRVLILGGGDGLAARELLKYPEVEDIVLVDLDPAVTRLGREHPVLRELNGGALDDPRVQVVNQDAYLFLEENRMPFGVIIVDLPDPKTVDLARLYSVQFYRLAKRNLITGGTLITQATSPFFSRQAFTCIYKTMGAADLQTTTFHNHIPTMGEWGWVLGWNLPAPPPRSMRELLNDQRFDTIDTRFLNRDAMISMSHFGKGILEDLNEITVNSETDDLSLHRYYAKGRWDFY